MKKEGILDLIESLRTKAIANEKAAKAVKEACSEIDDSWTHSSLTTHAKLHYKNFEQPSVEHIFDTEWGLIHGIPSGWGEKTNAQVVAEITRRSGIDPESLKLPATELENEFESLKREISLSLLENGIADTSDIEKFEVKTATDYFNDIYPTSFRTRDSAAVASGRYIAPHIYFKSIAALILSIPEQLERFSFLVKKKMRAPTAADVASQSSSDSSDDWWSAIHPDIRRVSEQQFKETHYMEAVRSAFIEFNDAVKQKYKRDSGSEEDGFNLMKLAFGDFSASTEIFTKGVKYSLDDLSTDSGRNFQKGFALIAGGSVLGLRNPRAHANLPGEREESMHLVFLASWLMKAIFPLQKTS